MEGDRPGFDFDTAIVGGGPAGLSAALVLGRARRRVVLFDHGQPRNFAAKAVHGFLGLDGVAPGELRERGRREAEAYGVQLLDEKVATGRCIRGTGLNQSYRLDGFQLQTTERSLTAKTVLLATGVVDDLPDVPGLKDLYGRSVHHCPYCDGWEHRDQHLVAFGSGSAAAKLALSLRTWSVRVTACSNGEPVGKAAKRQLRKTGIDYREERVARLVGHDGALKEVTFEQSAPLACDALFFSADKGQRSPLAAMLGCEIDDRDLVRTRNKQGTRVNGLFLAGDADGDVQFAIVAAAEGAIAATAINSALQKDEQSRT